MHVFVSYNMGQGFSIGVRVEILWSMNGVGRTFSRSVLRKNMDAKFCSSVWPLNLLDIFVIYFPHYFTTYTLDYFAKRDSCLAYITESISKRAGWRSVQKNLLFQAIIAFAGLKTPPLAPEQLKLRTLTPYNVLL